MNWATAFFAGDEHPDHHKPLDGLRGLAVLMVVFGHGANHGLGPFGPDSMMIRGKLGVYLFFVLSAYLLDRQIIKMFQQGRAQWDYWRYYFSRRILRIFPLFFLALVVFRLANAAGLKVVIHSWGQLWEHLALQRGDHIFWSIPVEFKYYLISPILLYFFHRVLRWNLWAMGITFAALFVGVYQYSMHWQPDSTSTLLYLNIFLMGTLVAVLERCVPNFWNALRTFKPASSLGWSVILAFSLWSWKMDDFTSINTFLPAAALWSIALAATFGPGWWASLLSFKPLRWVGKVSFSMYLFHIPVLMCVKILDWNPAVLWMVYLSATVVVCAVTYLCVEYPLQSFKPFPYGSKRAK
ncbi:MAG: acyltransferase family protein [Schleiferiaceae bacterium]